MTRGFVESRAVPGDAYRRPAMLCGHCLEKTLAARLECIQLWVEEDELSRLIAEQAEDQNETATGVQPSGRDAGSGGPTT